LKRKRKKRRKKEQIPNTLTIKNQSYMGGIMVKEDHSPNYSLASTLLNPSLPSENILRLTDISFRDDNPQK
jgi:hypothetical protein